MNDKLRFSLGLLKPVIIFSGVFFFAVQGFAGGEKFYNWKDDQGGVHFTNDPLNIPAKYRPRVNIKKMRDLPSPHTGTNSTKTPGEPAKEDAKEVEDKNVGKEDEKVAMREALNFLKNDIQRFQKYEDYYPNIRHARLLNQDIAAALPQKEALEEKLGKYDSPLIQNIRSFLKSSLQQDYAVKDLYPRENVFANEQIRLKEEGLQKNDLMAKLQAELASSSGGGSASSKPNAPDNGNIVSEVNKQDSESEKPVPGNRRGY